MSASIKNEPVVPVIRDPIVENVMQVRRILATEPKLIIVFGSAATAGQIRH